MRNKRRSTRTVFGGAHCVTQVWGAVLPLRSPPYRSPDTPADALSLDVPPIALSHVFWGGGGYPEFPSQPSLALLERTETETKPSPSRMDVKLTTAVFPSAPHGAWGRALSLARPRSVQGPVLDSNGTREGFPGPLPVHLVFFQCAIRS